VEVRWRSLFQSTSICKRCTSYNAPPTSRKRAADRWSLPNFLPRSFIFMVGKAQKSHGASSELISVLGWEKVARWYPIRTSSMQSRSRPMRFLGLSSHENGALRQEISKWWTVCSTFSRSGRSIVRCATLAKGGTSKKRPSPHLHKIPTRSNKVESTNFANGPVSYTELHHGVSTHKTSTWNITAVKSSKLAIQILNQLKWGSLGLSRVIGRVTNISYLICFLFHLTTLSQLLKL
jgi:hypothetical protein